MTALGLELCDVSLQAAVNDAWPTAAGEQKSATDATSVVDSLVADTLKALAARSA